MTPIEGALCLVVGIVACTAIILIVYAALTRDP
jgi:hypothetical protein